MDLKHPITSMKRVSTKSLVASVCVAAFLIIADYYVSNMTYPLFDTSSRLDLWSYIYDHDKGEDSDSDFVAVNVAYDKQLADTYDEYDRFIGYTPITDRAKLLRLLQIASKSNYRYIFLDIRFDKGLDTENDSALFALINSMPRIVVSTHRSSDDFECNPALSPDKRAYADYRIKRGNYFSRYEYLQDGNESVALRLYHDLNNGSIEEKPHYFTENGSLCYNMQFISIPKRVLLPEKESGEIRYPYLGAHLFGNNTDEEIIALLDNRIVLVGDFDNDVHDALIGSVPGPTLSFYAYKALVEGKHKVNYWLQAFLFILYVFISYRLISKKSVSEDEEAPKHLLPQIIGFFLQTGVILWILDAIMYFVFALSFAILIPTTVFTILAYKNAFVYWCKTLNNRIFERKNTQPNR